MKIPYGGKVSNRLIAKRFKGIQFWRIRRRKGGLSKAVPCAIRQDCEFEDCGFKDCVFVSEMNKKFNLESYSMCVSWSDLYESYFEADRIAEEENRLRKQFQREPFLTSKMIKEHFNDFMRIEKEINNALSEHENFVGIDFCDVSANGVQVRGHCKKITGYTYGEQPTIKYDFSNVDDVIREFVEMWKKYDTPEEIKAEQRFIYYGEKYGWD